MSTETQANNKRIAKNTLFLYGRMLLMMLVYLYTSRIVLNALGVEDYGIYNVVAGVVSMFSVLSGSLSAAISRFITFEMANGDIEKLKKVFCTAINVQTILIIIITILLETIGLWFLNYKMVIPESRMASANWVFQFSVITFAINLWSVPYNASIIAHEKMSAFAYISISDAIIKLLIAFVILKSPIDRLIYYGALMLIAGLIERFLYSYYCKCNFQECHYHISFDKSVTKEMFGFAGWNFIGAASAVLRDQGGNMLINLFCGPTVNAARGVAMSVNSAVRSFVGNFQTALNPQIIKNYASGDREYLLKLIFQGSRLSYYILLILALPILFSTPYLLDLWLGIVPEHTINFTRLVLLFTLSESLAGPLITTMLATGNIRNYQIIVGGCQLMNLPISYLLLQFGLPPEYIFVVAIVVSVLCEMARLIMLRGMINLPIKDFLKNVYFNVIVVTISASIIPYITIELIGLSNFLQFFIIVVVCILCAMLSIYTIGCNRHDRQLIHSIIKKVTQKF